ncbi:facilitated trehalose transporter Tret1 isoform X2 [Anabrus simplex]
MLPLTNDEISWIVSLMHVGHVLLAIPAGYMVDWVGRKWTLLFSATPFLMSWLLTALAEDSALEQDGDEQWYVRVDLLYFARLTAGLAVGVSSTIASIYLGEIAEDSVRGAIGTLFQVMINLGIMFEYSTAPYVSYGTLTMLSALIPLIFLMTFMFVPESPYYLLMHGRRKEAQKVLLTLRGLEDPDSVQMELNMMEVTVGCCRMNKGAFLDLFTSRCNLRALMICVGLFSITVCSGHVVILSYSTEMFKESRSSLDPSISVIILGGVQTLLSIIPSVLVDTAGRKPLLVVSSVGCAAALVVEGTYFYLLNNGVTGLDILPLLALIFFIMFFNLGLGSVPVAIMTEIFPTNVRGVASSFLSIYLAIMNFLITKVVLIAEVEYYVVFWTFSAYCLGGMLFIIYFVPETKGKSLLEINLEMKCLADDLKETRYLLERRSYSPSRKPEY